MMLLVFAGLLGCTPKNPASTTPSPANEARAEASRSGASPSAVVDPDALLARATTEAAPPPQLASFSVHLQTEKDQVSAQGSLIIAPPGRFRVELRGPIGPAALVVVCDGHTLTAWNTMKGLAWRSEDAEAALRGLTGNAAGVDAVVSLLLGRIPAIGTPAWTGEMFKWDGPGGEIVTAQLESRSGHLAVVQAADSAGALLLSAHYTPADFPKTLQVQLPTLHASAELSFSSWEPLSPPDAAFTVTLPESVTVAPIPLPAPAPPAAAPAPAQ